jgi:hypothetical protein
MLKLIGSCWKLMREVVGLRSCRSGRGRGKCMGGYGSGSCLLTMVQLIAVQQAGLNIHHQNQMRQLRSHIHDTDSTTGYYKDSHYSTDSIYQQSSGVIN